MQRSDEIAKLIESCNEDEKQVIEDEFDRETREAGDDDDEHQLDPSAGAGAGAGATDSSTAKTFGVVSRRSLSVATLCLVTSLEKVCT